MVLFCDEANERTVPLGEFPISASSVRWLQSRILAAIVFVGHWWVHVYCLAGVYFRVRKRMARVIP